MTRELKYKLGQEVIFLGQNYSVRLKGKILKAQYDSQIHCNIYDVHVPEIVRGKDVGDTARNCFEDMFEPLPD